MSNHRWCCCGGNLPANCCELQNCEGFVQPNSITITYTGKIERHYSHGQICTLSEYTYTIESVGSFSTFGNSCDAEFLTPDRLFYCPQARVSYQKKDYVWQPSTVEVYCQDQACTPENPAWTYECGACTPESDFCECRPLGPNWYKLYATGTATGTPRVIDGHSGPNEFYASCCATRPGAMAALVYFCCDVCGCIRPTIAFTPKDTTEGDGCFGIYLSGSDTYVYSETGNCNLNGPSTTTSDWVQFLPAMVLAGECGCPSATTWSNPVWDFGACRACATSLAGGIDYVFTFDSTCTPFITCDGLPQGVCASGKLSFEALCIKYDDPGCQTFGAVVCQYTLSFQDVVTQSVTVTIT